MTDLNQKRHVRIKTTLCFENGQLKGELKDLSSVLMQTMFKVTM